MSVSAAKSILIVGATGTLGSAVLNGFLADKYKGAVSVSVLARPLAADATDAKKAAAASLTARGVKVVTGDLSSSVEQLTPLLKGFDVVISAVAGANLGADQLRLISAAKAAGVRWFVPSEFGFDAAAAGRGSIIPIFDDKIIAVEAVKAAGLDYTLFATGAFTEYALSPFFGVDSATKTLTYPISGAAKFTTTTLADIGAIVADAIVTGKGRNATVKTAGATLTYAQLGDVLDRVSGSKWTRVTRSKADYEAALAKNTYDYQARFGLLLGDAKLEAANSWDVKESYNAKNGIAVTSVEESAKKAIKA